MTGEIRTHNARGHGPVLWPVELRSQRRRLESNQLPGRLQLPASPLGLVVISSARRAGIEPATSRFGVGDSSTEELPARLHFSLQCAGRDSNPRRPWANSSTGCRNCRSATYAVFQVSVEGLEPSTPCARGTCAAKLRYTLKLFQALPEGFEPSFPG